jgi:hypothetical protein
MGDKKRTTKQPRVKKVTVRRLSNNELETAHGGSPVPTISHTCQSGGCVTQ